MGARTILVLFLVAVHSHFGLFYEFPEVKIEVLEPRGLRVSIPDSANVTSFSFQGNINKAIEHTDVGEIGDELISTDKTGDKKWVIENTKVTLKKGDIIRYYVFITVDGLGYIKDGMTYVVGGGPLPTKAPTAPSTVTHPVTPKPCKLSRTYVSNKAVCEGEVIFEDNFNSPLSDSAWLIEQHIPEEDLEYPFISYQRSLVSVNEDHLRIHPELQQNMEGFNSDSTLLDLTGACTGTICTKLWDRGADILPPVASGRIRSRFSFKYGRIDIKAKLPQGDWLYSEILLEPLHHKYGKNGYASGLITIAKARGNKDFTTNVGGDEIQFGNSVLEANIVISKNCSSGFKHRRELVGINWGDNFHVFSVVWTPESIKFLVDDETVREVSPPQDGGFADLLRNKKGCYDVPNNYKNKISPFDDEFQIVLGVAAGSNSVFPDSPKKPWTNGSYKAKLDFWNSLEAWFPTWRGTSDLTVDFVKVTAL